MAETKGTDGFEGKQIGEIARTIAVSVLEAGLSKTELSNLHDRDFCTQHLGLTKPMLIPYQGHPVHHYYANPVTINGAKFLFTNDWFETDANNDRPFLLQWLSVHGVKNEMDLANLDFSRRMAKIGLQRIKMQNDSAAAQIKDLKKGNYAILLEGTPAKEEMIAIAESIRSNPQAKIALSLSHTELRELPDGIFAGCKNLRVLCLPNSFDSDLSIPDFEGCDSLLRILVGKDNKKFFSYDGVLYTKDNGTLYMCPPNKIRVTIPESAKAIYECAFALCNNLSEITYEGTFAQWERIEKDDGWSENVPLRAICCSDADILFKCKSVASKSDIDDDDDDDDAEALVESGILKAYFGDMKNVVIPDGVRVVAGVVEESESSREFPVIKRDNVFYYPFTGCEKIESVTMSDSVEIIGPKAFEHCSNLKSVTFSKNLRKIGLSAFLGCEKLTTLSLPASLETIESWAFGYIDIDEITFCGTLWQLEKMETDGAFSNIHLIHCSDCDINFDKKPFYIDEVKFPGTMEEFRQSYENNWISERTRKVICTDGSITVEV